MHYLGSWGTTNVNLLVIFAERVTCDVEAWIYVCPGNIFWTRYFSERTTMSFYWLHSLNVLMHDCVHLLVIFSERVTCEAKRYLLSWGITMCIQRYHCGMTLCIYWWRFLTLFIVKLGHDYVHSSVTFSECVTCEASTGNISERVIGA